MTQDVHMSSTAFSRSLNYNVKPKQTRCKQWNKDLKPGPNVQVWNWWNPPRRLICVDLSRAVYLSHCSSLCIPSTSFVPAQHHTLIKPPRMNLLYYWILCAVEYPQPSRVPSLFIAWLSVACWDRAGHNNTSVILNNRQEKKNWTSICWPLPPQDPSAGTGRRWIYLLSCLCMPMNETGGINNSLGGAWGAYRWAVRPGYTSQAVQHSRTKRDLSKPHPRCCRNY